MLAGHSMALTRRNAGLSLVARAIAILRKYGTDAHVNRFGIGTVSGLTAGNYLDSAGTTSASVDNPVGLSLDALQAMTLGSNLVPTVYTGTVSGAWTISASSVDRNGSSTGEASLGLSASLDTTKIYRIVFNVSGLTGDSFGFRVGSAGTAYQVSANGQYSACLPAGATTAAISFFAWVGATGTASITGVQCKEIPGIHLTQATTANKPILRRGLSNLALYARDYSNAVWTKRGSIVSASAVLDPDGVAATKLTEAATTDTHAAQQAFVSSASGYTVASIVKADARTIGAIRIYDGAAGYATYINLVTGATLTNAAGNTASFVDLGGGWFLYAVSRALPGSASSLAQVCAIAADNVLSYAGDETSGILLGRSAIFQGTLTAQQIIDAGGIPLTTTAAASNPNAGKYWAQFDSTDVLTATYPAGYEAATVIDAVKSGVVTNQGVNVVGAYSIGPSVNTAGRILMRTAPSAAELAVLQAYARLWI